MVNFIKFAGVVFCFCCLTGTVQAVTPYDTFSESKIDGSKWVAGKDNRVGLDQFRVVKDGIFKSYVAGSTYSGGELNNEFHFADPNTINSISVDIAIIGAELSGNVGFVGAAIEGNFYDESGGSVYAGIALGFGDGKYSVMYGVDSPNIDDSGILLDNLSLNTTYTLKLVYDGDRSFAFTVNGSSEKTVVGPIRTASSSTEHKALTTFVSGEQGQEGAGGVVASYDNVVVNAGLPTTFTEDFASSPLDVTRWSGNELIRNIKEERLQLKVQCNGTGNESLDAFIPSVNITDYLQADVVVQDISVVTGSDKTTNQGQARLMARYFNTLYDGSGYNGQEGNVFGMARIKYYSDTTLYPEAVVFRCDDAACSTATTLFEEGFSCTPSLNVPITMSIMKSGNTLFLKCGDDKKSYTLSGPTYAPETPIRFLRSRAYAESGQDTFMKVQFDNVYTLNSFPWTMFLPAITKPVD